MPLGSLKEEVEKSEGTSKKSKEKGGWDPTTFVGRRVDADNAVNDPWPVYVKTRKR